MSVVPSFSVEESSSFASRVAPILASEDGLLKLLVAIRGSRMDQDLKMVIRDLVLELSDLTDSSKRDIVVNDIVEALTPCQNEFIPLLEHFSGTASSPSAVPPPDLHRPETDTASVPLQSFRRQEPVFGATEKTILSTPIVEVPTKTIVTDTVAAISETSSPSPLEPVPMTATESEVISKQPLMTKEGAGQRIIEIKRSVNQLFGNPVNLMDVDPQVGRGYMNALLSAMKIVSGTEGDLGGAMATLEETFTKVKALDVSKLQTQPLVNPKEDIEPINPVEKHETKDVIEKQKPQSERVAETDVRPVSVMPSMQKNSVPVAETSPSVTQRAPEQPKKRPTLRSVAEEIKEARATVAITAAEHTPQATAKETIDDPLHSHDVDAGLAQLLSEWKLFKSSGIFGTGPSGKDHPRYRQLASLPMAAIIAGRFEDSSSDIRQSITDYMNGWRYEHGMIHEINETFEHYLRRVVHHIITRQKKPATA